jgi:hypothetical protein
LLDGCRYIPGWQNAHPAVHPTKNPTPLPAGEESAKGALSGRVRDLILGFDAKDRRRPDGDGAATAGERRRRSDHNEQPLTSRDDKIVAVEEFRRHRGES